MLDVGEQLSGMAFLVRFFEMSTALIEKSVFVLPGLSLKAGVQLSRFVPSALASLLFSAIWMVSGVSH